MRVATEPSWSRGMRVVTSATTDPSWSRRHLMISLAAASVACPRPATASDKRLAELAARLGSDSPRQLMSGPFTVSGVRGEDSLRFPPWMEGEWRVTSNVISFAAPLGRKFLPTDLSRVPLGDLRSRAPPLSYVIRFSKRTSDGGIVSAREDNLRASQNAAAGYSRVDNVIFDGTSSLKVTSIKTPR